MRAPAADVKRRGRARLAAENSQADFDLDDIWHYMATRSGSIDIADRLIDSITMRFELLAQHPLAADQGTTIYAPNCGVFR